MALVTTADVLTATKNVGAAPVGSELYNQFDQLRRMMERIVKKYLNWPVEANDGMGSGNYVEYYDGKNYMDVVLRRPWVSKIVEVVLNGLGAYGQSNQGFSTGSVLTAGSDYALASEQPGKCESGLLRRLGNNAALQGWWPGTTTYQGSGHMSYGKGPVWPQGSGNIRVKYDWGFQSSTTISAATWAAGVATFTFASAIVARPTDDFVVKDSTPSGWNGDWQVATVASNGLSITANVGSDPGTPMTGFGTASFVPLDIQAAVCQAVTIQRAQMQYGGRLGSETLGDYNYSLNFATSPEFGSVKQMLSAWRDTSAGIALA